MSKITLIPYLFFDGNCREAMEFYKSVFGGELSLMTYEQAPTDSPDKEEMKGKIMNAGLTGGDVVLMASDTRGSSPVTRKVELCVTGSDEARLREIFDALSQGGTVKYPLTKEFWGDIFGTLTDKFGIDWMIDISTAG